MMFKLLFIRQSLEGGLKVDNIPGLSQWPSRWLIATGALIR